MKPDAWQSHLGVSIIIFRLVAAYTVVIQDTWPNSGNIQVHPEVDLEACYSTHSAQESVIVNVGVLNGDKPNAPSGNGNGILKAMALYPTADCSGDTALIIRWNNPEFSDIFRWQFFQLDAANPSLANTYLSWKPVGPSGGQWINKVSLLAISSPGYAISMTNGKAAPNVVRYDASQRKLVKTSRSDTYKAGLDKLKSSWRGKSENWS